MADTAASLRLMAWLSPAFPVGAFSYSHGLERAAGDGLVANANGLTDWLQVLLDHGTAWNDALLAAQAWKRATTDGDLVELAELCEAMAGSVERHLETMAQGAAFVKYVAQWTGERTLPDPCPYPVAFGASAGWVGLDLDATVAAFAQGFASNQIQAGIRLSLLGQDAGVRLLHALEPRIVAMADRAALASLDDLGSAALTAEIAAMNHETQHVRLFRS
ncbi:urease accessory protein UreF [Aliihoeflea aestuarii]|jgi:urease accessory protein|uniref:urease accessory protein UreF n=1 Tax=Aliihoeflea aestuarii TaxID=453840 RepID=UPI002093B35F|nr:urease accessory protein UreF [Aliihoeflea aestuarii]